MNKEKLWQQENDIYAQGKQSAEKLVTLRAIKVKAKDFS